MITKINLSCAELGPAQPQLVSILDCENKVLSPYFDSRVGEIKEHRNEWRKYSKVNTVQHTPGSLNPADICTKGKAKADDIMFGLDWQLGPEYLQFDDKQLGHCQILSLPIFLTNAN